MTGVERDARCHRNAGGVQQHLGVVLVHARGRGEHAAAHVRHAHHLEQALNRAILAERAVQGGQHHVNMTERIKRAVGIAGVESVAAVANGEHHFARIGRLNRLGESFGQIPAERVLAVYKPGAGLRDADRHGLEQFRVERAHECGGGDAGNRMFVRLAAVENRHPCLRHCHLLMPGHIAPGILLHAL